MSRQVLTYPDIPNLDLKYLQLSGGTLTNTLTVTPPGGAPSLVAQGAAGNESSVAIRSDDDQWAMLRLNTRADAARWLFGANPTFKDFAFARYNNAGGFAGFPLTISRATGTVTLAPDAGSPAISVGDGVALAVGAQASAWDAGWDVIQFPNQAIACNGAAANTMEIIANSYVSGGVRRAMVGTLPAVMVHLTGGAFEVHSAPLVATGAQQAFGRRMLIDTATGTAYFYPIPGNWSAFFNQSVGPLTDNFANLGYTANRWIGVYAVQGAINTCSQEVKEIIGPVNDTVALEQLMGLPAIYRFHYKHQQEDPENEGQYVTVTDTSREFIGPIAEEMPMDMKVGEVTTGNVNTEGHLMASLRGAVLEYRTRIMHLEQRIAALEGRMPA